MRTPLAVLVILGAAACGPAPRWFFSCGDPVCRGYTPRAGVAACTSERAGDDCRAEGAQCDPQDGCNRLLVCATEDPRQQLGGCPISRAAFKEDVRYLDAAERRAFRDQLLGLPLATWRYRQGDGRSRLGFLIEDAPAMCVDPERDMVDLYGYTSLAVATLQEQQAEIADLRRRIGALERQALDGCGGQNGSRESRVQSRE